MEPGVCPTRWIASSSTSPTRTVSPSRTGSVTGTGSGPASSGWATVRAPVALATAANACQWSPCWWVVTIVRTGASPITSSSRSASLAASISNASPVALERSRYALLSNGPTDTLVMVSADNSRVCAGPPGVTLPVYSLIALSSPRRCAAPIPPPPGHGAAAGASAGGELDRATQPDVARAAPEQDRVPAAGHPPAARSGVPVAEGPAVQGERHAPGL